MKRKDLLTGEEFIPSRKNQKFATPENRIIYYNNKANQLRLKAAFINKPLHQNLLILNELLAEKTEAVFHKQFLAGKGMSFKVHTHYETHEGQTVFAIYQYLIIALANERIKIIKK